MHVEVKAVEVEAKEVYSYLLEVEALLLLETRSYSSFDVVQSSTLARRRLLRVVLLIYNINIHVQFCLIILMFLIKRMWSQSQFTFSFQFQFQSLSLD